MQFFTANIVLSSLWAAALVSADFPLAAWDDDGAQRVWYGDGNLYVGSTVPADVQIAFNFTILEPRNTNFDFWFLVPSAGQTTEPVLQTGQTPFLAIHHTTPDSAVFFTEDVAKFDDPVAYTFMQYQSMVIPVGEDGEPIVGGTFLVETSAAGTYMVVWNEDRGAAGGKECSLLTSLDVEVEGVE